MRACSAVTYSSVRSGANFPKAVAKITGNLDEPTFATVRHRAKVTKGPGSRAAGLAMAFKLTGSAQARWRCVNAPHLVAQVRAGAVFRDGALTGRPGQAAA